LRTNFAALAIENSTAIRLFLTMAQILHHVDADTPIRMLVAECEQPTTMLAALYFAKLFGIEDKVDVSPLFETETALEHGGRFLDALLAEPAYRAYARGRGRVSIQTGFSDAGALWAKSRGAGHRTPSGAPGRGDDRQPVGRMFPR
jgi:phosphoenolpyruvate carboxylase